MFASDPARGRGTSLLLRGASATFRRAGLLGVSGPGAARDVLPAAMEGVVHCACVVRVAPPGNRILGVAVPSSSGSWRRCTSWALVSSARRRQSPTAACVPRRSCVLSSIRRLRLISEAVFRAASFAGAWRWSIADYLGRRFSDGTSAGPRLAGALQWRPGLTRRSHDELSQRLGNGILRCARFAAVCFLVRLPLAAARRFGVSA